MILRNLKFLIVFIFLVSCSLESNSKLDNVKNKGNKIPDVKIKTSKKTFIKILE